MSGIFLTASVTNGNVSVSENPRVQWMKGKYGLMVHWIAPGPLPQKGEHVKDLDKAVDNFDINGFMADFDKTGADWLIFTIGQNRGFYASPNTVIDSLAGFGHTPQRDLVLEIAKAVKKRGKKFIAYLPCEVKGNPTMQESFGWNTQPGTDQAEFQEKYLKAVREWAVRFGQNLDGWWFDGCFFWDEFHNKYMKWENWYEASRAGNKNAAITFNDGSFCINITKPVVGSYDYLSGETEVLINGKIRLGGRGKEDGTKLFMPEQAYVEGTQCLYHALLPIDAFWGHSNPWKAWQNVPFIPVIPKQGEMEPPVYSDKDLLKFVSDFTKVGGAVTLNVGIFQEGRLGKETIKQLEKLRVENINSQEKVNKKQPSTLQPALNASFTLDGYLRKRIDKSIHQYLLETPESSPAILQVLRDRDRSPLRKPLTPWAGEFAGKYLTGAQLVWRLTHDAELKKTIDLFVRDLILCQAPDGYLGPFPKESRLTGKNWDVWGHYHSMLGLMLYYEDNQFEPALKACEKIADLLCGIFGPGRPSLQCDGSGGQMNMAVCHGLVLLYEKTGVKKYLDLANYIVDEAWNEEGAGKYLNSALEGKPIVKFPLHRWEAIHDWQVLGELYQLTGDTKYRIAMEKIWHCGVDGDRHNTGGITAGEGFTGSPYNQGAIETCCTVAWTAFSADVLQMTGNSKVADEIEWSTFNSALGAIPYSGKVCAYNVPMNGTRAFGTELSWQSPMAGPDLNCCSVNAYRPLGMISQWALMQSSEGPVLNFYGPGKISTTLPSHNQMTLMQETEYPAEGLVKIVLNLKKTETFTLKLRIPFWSTNTGIKINGKTIAEKTEPGTYLSINRTWKSDDKIDLLLDFKLRFWYGEKECKEKISVYRGPILCTYDARFNDFDPNSIPELDAASLKFERQMFDGAIEPWVYGVLKDKSGAKINVCDFSSAGQTGNHYCSWLPLVKESNTP